MSEAAPLSPRIDIAPEHWRIVRGILRRHAPGVPVWAFGSRTKGTARPYSDLDLALITDAPLALEALAALKEAFSESDLPWPVDIVDCSSVSGGFRRIIEREHVVLIDEGVAGQ
jgi:predicted nucleotidyltransferase